MRRAFMVQNFEVRQVYIPDSEETLGRLVSSGIASSPARQLLGRVFDAIPNPDPPQWEWFIITGNKNHAEYRYTSPYLKGWWLHHGIAVSDPFKVMLYKHRPQKVRDEN